MTDTLLTAFAQAVDRFGAQTALVTGAGQEVSFKDIDARAKALAAAWSAHGMGRGDRILIAMPIGPDLYAGLAAIWSLGAVAVLPEPAMGLAGVRAAIASAGVTGLCASGGYRLLRLLPTLWGMPVFHTGQSSSAVPEPTGISADDLALISFTSGSTGAPKAIPRSHAFLMAQQAAVAPLLSSQGAERDLVAFPVFVLINLAAGRTSILPNWKMSRLDRVTPDALSAWMAQTRATRALLPPALCETLANGTSTSHLHTLFTGGGPVFPDLTDRLTRTGLRVVSVYGSTEAEPIAHLDSADVTPADQDAMRHGRGLLAGHPVDPVKLRINDGEILVAGDHVNAGYLDPLRDVETKIRDGATIWHRTGDAGRLDADGRLWLLGRYGQATQVQGKLLYPFEVETAARFWAGVQRVAFVGDGASTLLAVQGDATHLPEWQSKARALGISEVRHLDRLPMDRRHRSKINMKALRVKLGISR